ncbi:MAG: hypothetical protein EOO20_18230 [Chryseobacterium sp.]|nr:MAG: hypothetical protein EOO20_18230 [Chryseobacterium sp.]
MLNNLKRSACLLGISYILSSCSSTNNKPVSIEFSADSSSIVVKGVEQDGLYQLKSIADTDSLRNQLLSVVQTPSDADTAIMETPIAGKVLVTDSNVVFMPAEPFVKGRAYLVSTYLNSRFASTGNVLKGKMDYRVKPAEQLLQR